MTTEEPLREIRGYEPKVFEYIAVALLVTLAIMCFIGVGLFRQFIPTAATVAVIAGGLVLIVAAILTFRWAVRKTGTLHFELNEKGIYHRFYKQTFEWWTIADIYVIDIAERTSMGERMVKAATIGRKSYDQIALGIKLNAHGMRKYDKALHGLGRNPKLESDELMLPSAFVPPAPQLVEEAKRWSAKYRPAQVAKVNEAIRSKQSQTKKAKTGH